jgi:hypothetical protein
MVAKGRSSIVVCDFSNLTAAKSRSLSADLMPLLFFEDDNRLSNMKIEKNILTTSIPILGPFIALTRHIDIELMSFMQQTI